MPSHIFSDNATFTEANVGARDRPPPCLWIWSKAMLPANVFPNPKSTSFSYNTEMMFTWYEQR